VTTSDEVTSPGFGHVAVIPPRIGRAPARIAADVLARFRGAYVPDVSDAVGELYTMSGIRPLYEPTPRLVGQALTVKAPVADNLTIHGALGIAGENDVLVIDWRGYTGGCATGAGSLVDPIARGLAGAVVDGGWRDIEELQYLAFPVFGRAIAPFSPPKSRIGEINVPVSCGGVVVCPGDVLVGDAEGIVVVPAAYAAAVADALRDYSPRAEWDTAGLAVTARSRERFFEHAFRQAGGVDEREGST
jgi:4-hydroxy-4-methyl-2-oxoglutarate aldolase